jgi:hypothetical protein
MLFGAAGVLTELHARIESVRYRTSTSAFMIEKMLFVPRAQKLLWGIWIHKSWINYISVPNFEHHSIPNHQLQHNPSDLQRNTCSSASIRWATVAMQGHCYCAHHVARLMKLVSAGADSTSCLSSTLCAAPNFAPLDPETPQSLYLEVDVTEDGP